MASSTWDWVGSALVAGLPAAISLVGIWWLNRNAGLGSLERAIETSKQVHALQTPDANVLRVHYYQSLVRVVGRSRVLLRAGLGLLLIALGLAYLDGIGVTLDRRIAFVTALYSIPLGLFLLESARRRLLASIGLTLELQRLESEARQAIAVRQTEADAMRQLNRFDVWMQARLESLRSFALRNRWLAPAILGSCVVALGLLFAYLYYCYGGECPPSAPSWIEWFNRMIR